MDNDRGRMQKSIDGWLEKAENENAHGAVHNSPDEKGKEDESATKSAKFTVNIPENEFGPQEPGGRTADGGQSAETGAEGREETEENGRLSSFLKKLEDPEEDGEPEEKNGQEGEPDAQWLGGEVKSLASSVIVGAIFTALLIFLEFAPSLGASLPFVIDWSQSPQEYVILNAALLVFTGVLFGRSLLHGFKGLVTFSADGDSLCSVAFAGALAENVYLLWKPAAVENGSVCLVSAVAASCLLFNGLGRLFEMVRAKNNLKWLEDNDVFKAAVTLDDSRRADLLTDGLNYESAKVMCTRKAVFLTDYMENAFCRTSYDNAARVFAPVVLIAAVINFLNEYFFLQNHLQAFVMLSVVCCIGTPLSGALNPQLPLWRACRALRKRKAMLSGFKAALAYSDVDAVAMDAGDVFPDGRVNLRGIKSFKGRNIDGVILDAASLVCAAGGTLAGVFMQIIGNRTDVLKEVQGYQYEDFSGLCGLVEGRRIMVGTREMMGKHGVSVPPRSAEAKYLSNGWDILYIAESGELCALLILGYDATDRTAESLWRMQKLDVSLLLTARDPNITSAMLAENVGLDGHKTKVLSSAESELLRQENGDGCTAEALLAFTGGADAIAGAVFSCVRLKGIARALAVLQIAGAFLGILLMMYLSVKSGSSQALPLRMMAYQAIWSLPVLFLAMFRKLV